MGNNWQMYEISKETQYTISAKAGPHKRLALYSAKVRRGSVRVKSGGSLSEIRLAWPVARPRADQMQA